MERGAVGRAPAAHSSAQLFTIERQLRQTSLQLRHQSSAAPQTSQRSTPAMSSEVSSGAAAGDGAGAGRADPVDVKATRAASGLNQSRMGGVRWSRHSLSRAAA